MADGRPLSRAEQRAMMLFTQIITVLNPEEFSLEEIWDEFGAYGTVDETHSERTPHTEGSLGFWKIYPRGELNTLIRMGYVEPIENIPELFRITEAGRVFAEE